MPQESPAASSKRGPRRKRLYIFLAAAAGLILVGLAWLLIPYSPDRPLQLWSVVFSPDGKTLATAGGQDAPETLPQIGEVVIWNAANGRKKRIIRQQWGVRRAVFSPDGSFIVTADFGGKTRLLDAKTGKIKALLTPQYSQVNAVAISADGKLIAGGSFDGSVTLWDPSGKEVGTLQAPNEKIVNLAISPDAAFLVAGCRLGKAYLFNLAQHTPPKVLPAYRGPPSYWSGIEAVAFAPDGQTFVTGGMELRIWRTASGDLIRDLPRAGSARINCLTFAPDGNALAGTDRDGLLVLWNPATGELSRSIQAHTGSSFGIAFSPDGGELASVDRKDLAIKIWDARSLALLKTFIRGAKHP